MYTQVDNVNPEISVPYSLEAEQAVLGGLMLANEEWDSICEILCENDFYLRIHRVIFSEMHVLIQRNSPLDLITLSDVLKSKGLEEQCG